MRVVFTAEDRHPGSVIFAFRSYMRQNFPEYRIGKARSETVSKAYQRRQWHKVTP